MVMRQVGENNEGRVHTDSLEGAVDSVEGEEGVHWQEER